VNTGTLKKEMLFGLDVPPQKFNTVYHYLNVQKLVDAINLDFRVRVIVRIGHRASRFLAPYIAVAVGKRRGPKRLRRETTSLVSVATLSDSGTRSLYFCGTPTPTLGLIV